MAQDTLKVFGTTYTDVTGFIASDGNSGTLTYVRPDGTYTFTGAGTQDVTAYANATVSSGTAGTPSATINIDTGNSEATITPTVTNTTGFITGSTKTGTAQTITARDLVSGNMLVCDEANTWDCSGAEFFIVGAGTEGTPTATKGTVSSHSVTVTPKVVNQEGWITGGTRTGTGVTVSASELVSGNLPITANGTGIDVTNYATVSVDVPVSPTTITAGDTPVMMATSTTRVANTSYVTTNCSITIPKAGTYKFYWTGMRSSTSGTSGTRLYKNNVAQGTAQETWSTNIQECTLSLTCAKNDVITIYARSRGTSYYAYCPMLVACIDWDNGFTT